MFVLYLLMFSKILIVSILAVFNVLKIKKRNGYKKFLEKNLIILT